MFSQFYKIITFQLFYVLFHLENRDDRRGRGDELSGVELTAEQSRQTVQSSSIFSFF
jgi:hypothetical protein